MRLTLALLILTALVATPVLADELKPIRSITVTGQAERKVVPDMAYLSVNVSATNPDAKQAKSLYDEKMHKVLEVIKDADIDEKKIATQQSGIQPWCEPDDATATPLGKGCKRNYRFSTQLMVTVQPLEKLAALMDKLTPVLEDKADTQRSWQQALSLNYTISNPEKIRAEMATDAIQNAREKADQMAAAAGASVNSVYQITEGNVPIFNHPMPVMAMSRMGASNGMAMAAPAPAAAPPAGEQEVNASVTITYELQ